jgi:hypothetical protein
MKLLSTWFWLRHGLEFGQRGGFGHGRGSSMGGRVQCDRGTMESISARRWPRR